MLEIRAKNYDGKVIGLWCVRTSVDQFYKLFNATTIIFKDERTQKYIFLNPAKVMFEITEQM